MPREHRCLSQGPRNTLSVVPAKAGIHNHRCCLSRNAGTTSPGHNNRRGVWVPACAGTTPGKEPWALSAVMPARVGIRYAAASRLKQRRLWNTGSPHARVMTPVVTTTSFGCGHATAHRLPGGPSRTAGRGPRICGAGRVWRVRSRRLRSGPERHPDRRPHLSRRPPDALRFRPPPVLLKRPSPIPTLYIKRYAVSGRNSRTYFSTLGIGTPQPRPSLQYLAI